ncbi:MAG: hypothetical protein ACOY9Y_10485 [Bacillota bacterium]
MIVKEVNDPSGTGVAVSVGNVGGFLGTSLMQLLSGLVLDWGWQGQVVNGIKFYPLEAFRMAFAACGLVVVAVLVVILIIKETKCKNIYLQCQGNPSRDVQSGC